MNLKMERITKDSRFWDRINALAKEAFPPEEYLSPDQLVEMSEDCGMDFLALSDRDVFIGYMAVLSYENLAYLFFLAIDPSFRSKGYGALAIETMKDLYPEKKHVVDFEMPDRSAQNYVQRQRRRNFYLRNGYRETGQFLTYRGVDYEVFCMEEDFDPGEFAAMLNTISLEGFHPVFFRK